MRREWPDLDRFVRAEEAPEPETQRALVRLGGRGAHAAARAAAVAPERADAHLYHGLNLSLEAIGRGEMSAFLRGLPRRIRRACDRAVELDALALRGGPLRLRGRFLTLVPWPLRDRAAAEAALERARREAPTRQALLFLGDLHWLRRRPERAREAWRTALALFPDPEWAELDGLVAELARRRLALLAEETGLDGEAGAEGEGHAG